MAGKFIPFLLPFKEHNHIISNEEQAQRILDMAGGLLKENIKGVAIIYSANYNQTIAIQNTYSSGNWNTYTSGSNQAGVMAAMEQLQENTYSHLQGKVRIAPITTMTYSNYGGKTHEQVIKDDFLSIEKLLKEGWYVLGWINQSTTPNFAIGGGIVQLSDSLSDLIQGSLQGFKKTYHE